LNRTIIVKVIVGGWVVYFFGTQCSNHFWSMHRVEIKAVYLFEVLTITT